MSRHVSPISQLVHSTARILCSDAQGRQSSGSGYIYLFCKSDESAIPCIVTNKHVVRNAIQGTFNLTRKTADGSADLGNHDLITVADIENICIYHPDPNIDLVAFPIGQILNEASKNGKDYFFIPLGPDLLPTPDLLESLSPMEEIVMIGYPNGIWDETHNLPIIRRGITATHPKIDLNGKPEFLIDAACFPGSSGSPVFLANIGGYAEGGGFSIGTRIFLLGTLYAGPQHTTTGEVVVVNVPTDTKTLAIGTIPNNLGYVIQASALYALEDRVRAVTQPPSSRNSPCPCQSGRRFKACCGQL